MKHSRILLTCLMAAASMSYRSPTDGDANQNGGAPTSDDPKESAKNTGSSPASLADGDAAENVQKGESISQDPVSFAPHPAVGVIAEIETAVNNFGHELSTEFKGIMASLIAKASLPV